MNEETFSNPTLVGATLKQARISCGLTINQISEPLLLTTTVIERLEADDYAMLPNTVFVKGYIRGYAKLVGLDGHDMVALFEAEVNQDTQEQPVPNPVTVVESQYNDKILWYSLVGLFALVLSIGFWWSQNSLYSPKTISHIETDSQSVTPLTTAVASYDVQQTNPKVSKPQEVVQKKSDVPKREKPSSRKQKDSRITIGKGNPEESMTIRVAS